MSFEQLGPGQYGKDVDVCKTCWMSCRLFRHSSDDVFTLNIRNLNSLPYCPIFYFVIHFFFKKALEFIDHLMYVHVIKILMLKS